MKLLFKKTMLFALVAALVVAAMPFVSASAAGENDPSTPPQISNAKLEQVWARQLQTYEKIGKGYERLDEVTARAQKMIDSAKENGKDVSAVQAALDAFEAAAKEAHPTYESVKGIVNSHQGFDATGKVTDLEKAQQTVKEMGTKLKEFHSAMDGTGKALREAIKAFREANPRPKPTTAPSGA